ncbi:FtsW/RodA/SpoVE family cell cycle protein [Streptococcus pacificus]|uniref:FtsW/RodA/SpoVE family cell cycle protein n=1 Tax=Streptococcus pacificus TaxID=2740577 RepID=A0ABS0ZJD5_9STRE|nr:FtsW/RodA/SpoVE family cell cycle protein [Streptococcus pacificus]MBJ8325978.1 FtsW/RodA/SpoVE family cell cycle protein [Streptococcus pacificus]
MEKIKKAIDNRIDYLLILPVFILLIIGLLAVYIAINHDYPQNLTTVLAQQVLWIITGFALSFVVMLFSTEFLWKITPFLYILGLGLMILPLFFYSPQLVALTGAKNWITIGNTTLFQPSEFMKISYILVLSQATVKLQQNIVNRFFKDDLKLLLVYGLLTLPVLVLLALQKDLGTALVFIAILSGLILLSGISWQLIVFVTTLIISGAVGFLAMFLSPMGKSFFYQLGMDTYQINRISAWLNPFDFADSIAYQQTQGMISIGSGGFTGKGLNVVDLSVPVRESDMIFTVIAENFGFIGSSLLLALYLFLIYRMIRVTFESNNLFYTYISTGFIMMILFHIFENIGATIGVLPLTGIPLPFISQGGSSLISNLLGVGLILSMSYQNQKNKESFIEEQESIN